MKTLYSEHQPTLIHTLAKQVPAMWSGFTIATRHGDIAVEAGPLAVLMAAQLELALRSKLRVLEAQRANPDALPRASLSTSTGHLPMTEHTSFEDCKTALLRLAHTTARASTAGELHALLLADIGAPYHAFDVLRLGYELLVLIDNLVTHICDSQGDASAPLDAGAPL